MLDQSWQVSAASKELDLEAYGTQKFQTTAHLSGTPRADTPSQADTPPRKGTPPRANSPRRDGTPPRADSPRADPFHRADPPPRVDSPPRAGSPAWPANCPTPGSNRNHSQPMKVARDMQTITTKGFRTLGLASTFIAGVEAQIFGIVSGLDAQESSLLQASNGCLLVGILLSAFGAITSFLASRWFELLKPDEVVWLEHRWAYARHEVTRSVPEYTRHRYRLRNWLVAKSLGMPFYMILFGAWFFVVGLVLYTWAKQIRPIAIACTVVTGLCGSVVLGMYLKYDPKGVLAHTKFTRVRI